MSDEESIEMLRERLRLSKLTYTDLRKEAKAFSIKGNIKKIDMIDAIVHAKEEERESALEALAKSDANEKVQDKIVETGQQQKDDQQREEAKFFESIRSEKMEDGEEDADESSSAAVFKQLPLSQQEEEEDAMKDSNRRSETYTVEEGFTRQRASSLAADEDNTQWLSADEAGEDDDDCKMVVEQTMEMDEESVSMETEKVNDENSRVAAAALSPPSPQEGWMQRAADKLQKMLSEEDLEQEQLLEEKRRSKSEQAPPLLPTTVSPSTSTSVSGYNRFALLHAKEFYGMPSILEDRERHAKRHAELTAGIPEVYKRLASPKQAARPYQQFMKMEKEETAIKFQFGQGLQPGGVALMSADRNAQKPLSRMDSMTPAIAKRMRTPRTDVKSQTMLAKKTPLSSTVTPKTTPVWSDRINKLAMPKGQKITFDEDMGCSSTTDGDGADSSLGNNKQRSTYTPHRGAYKYVDTTKMSDKAFTAYERERRAKKAEECIGVEGGTTMEEGTASGGSRKSSMFEL